jgi:hypothetical protein
MSKPSSNLRVAAIHRSQSPSLALLCLLIGAMASAEVPQPAEKAEEHALPLPRWSEHELKTFRDSLPVLNSPGVLPPNNKGESIADINELIHTPLTSGPRLDHLFNQRSSELSPRLQAEDMRLFLPESILGMPEQSQTSTTQLPTSLVALQDVSPEFLASCAQSLPKEYLIDPEQLVPEIQNHDMMRLLEFHARDARIKLFVLMIAHDQQLPEGAELEKIASGSLLHSDACLLIYPLGEPWRTRLFVSNSIHNQISTGFLSDTIQACLHESLQTSNVHDQLRRYTIHLSTRLFWLQKALGTEPSKKAITRQTLAEFNPQIKAVSISSSEKTILMAVGIAGSLVMLGLVGLASRQLLSRLRLRRQRRIWMLSEPETVPRLGGAFTGGGGGMIRYA